MLPAAIAECGITNFLSFSRVGRWLLTPLAGRGYVQGSATELVIFSTDQILPCYVIRSPNSKGGAACSIM